MNRIPERSTVLSNPRADRVRAVGALVGRSARSRSRRILVEGPQAVRELLVHRASCVVDVYFTEAAAAAHPDVYALAGTATRWRHLMTDEVSAQMSADSQGIVAVAERAALVGELGQIPARSTLVILAQGRDPGNVGTIIRTADAMGAAVIIAVSGTVETANPKVIRSSAGSVFHLPIVQAASFDEAVALVRSIDGVLLGTSGGHGSRDLADLMFFCALEARGYLARTHAWVFGNEAKGMSETELAACDALVRIGMTGDAESLNVASAAAMCLFASQSVRASLA